MRSRYQVRGMWKTTMVEPSMFHETDSLPEAKAKAEEAKSAGNLNVHVFDTVTKSVVD